MLLFFRGPGSYKGFMSRFFGWTGRFGAMMNVSLVNNGPFTVIIDTRQTRASQRS